jgi:uncharacterized membrane protein YgcG
MQFGNRAIAVGALVLAVSPFTFAGQRIAQQRPIRPRPAAAEAIELFHSDVTVAPDATVTVRETIRVRSAGNSIRHGIFRDFPTQYRDHLGNRFVVGFLVLEVQRDGRPEPFTLETIANGIRVRIGAANFELPPGEYSYSLAYRTNRQLGFFADHDELYWNVTGNAWVFPIERAEATVRLPAAIPRDALHLEAFTGPVGARGADFMASVAGDGTVEFESTRGLESREGLTAVITWPKGYFTPPTPAQQFTYLLQDNRAVWIGFAGLALLLCYYFLVWSAVGRDPPASAIVVRYEPPAGLSAAGMRYLARMGFDQKTFSVATLSLAVKRYLSIRNEGGTYTLVRNQGTNPTLAPEEQALALNLLNSSSQIDLSQQNHAAVQAAIKATHESLKNTEEKIYFFTHSRYVIPGLVFSALVLVGALISLPGQQSVISAFLGVWLTMWSAAVFAMVMIAGRLWKQVLTSGSMQRLTAGSSMKGMPALGAGVMSMFALPFLGGEVVGLFMLLRLGSAWFVLLLAALVGINIWFHYLLKAPTLAGRALMDQVEGFKRYFMAVERDPMQRLEGPEVTPELFDKYLPYAVALDVEQVWSKRFAAALQRAGQAPTSYSPAWYSGSAWSSFGPTGFASALGSSLTTATASASQAPGSSSGSGGGGSSGGGGGGGGGGGW